MRVYLDQNAWIGLLRAKEGRREGLRHTDTLLLIEAAVERGWLSLPLSYVHYIETARRLPYAKRESLAKLQAQLSGYKTVAPFSALVRAELRGAIAEWFDSRVVPSAPLPFGVGADHAFGFTVIEDSISNLVMRHGKRARFSRPILEWGALAGHPDNDVLPEQPAEPLHEMMKREAERLERLRSLRRPDGWTRGEKAKRVWNAQAYVDVLDEFNDAFEEADVPAGHLMARGIDAMTAFLRDVPTLHARYELGRLKEQATSTKWSANDLRDLEALSVALVYTDIVVTEKSWTSFAARTGLGKTHGTVVLEDISKLPELLIRGR